jgi:uncharacterized RDD family membrane protein YckC
MAKFVTNQNIEIDLNLASLGDRILAFLLDAVIIIGYVIGMGYLFSQIFPESEIPLIVISISIMFYTLMFETFYNGQTPGKKAMDIKVVKLDGGQPTFINYLLRWILRPIDIILYGAIAMAFIIATRYGQRLGDLAAGTTVIKLRNNLKVRDVESLKKNENHEVTYPQVKRLSDSQIELIRKSLRMRRDGFNDEAVVELSAKVKDILQIETSEPDVKFLYTIVRDYEHIHEER